MSFPHVQFYQRILFFYLFIAVYSSSIHNSYTNFSYHDLKRTYYHKQYLLKNSKQKEVKMKNRLLKLLLITGFTLGLNASTPSQPAKPMPEATIKKMDHQLTKHKAVKRNFKTQKEFKHHQQRKMVHRKNKHIKSKSMRYADGYANGYNYNRYEYEDDYRPIRQRGHRYTKRGWVLAYKYDRASFYDNQGYFYGYFNRYGYYFEDIFYRYDRYYTYRDRVRGRGLFDQRYYMPQNAQYYGFCETHYQDRGYERNYERGYNRY